MSETDVQELINSADIVVFSKTWCSYCSRAKKLLNGVKGSHSIKIIELDVIGNGSQIQNTLQKMTRQSTVPNIFIHKKHIGGCDDVHSLHSQDKLLPMIEQS